MITPKYTGHFTQRDDVAKEFEEGSGNRWDGNAFVVAKDFPTEAQILYANYDTPPYEGSAFVLFTRGGKLFEVNGSHCSCFGLEGQWKPEETSWEALAMRQPSEYGAPQAVVAEAHKRVATARKMQQRRDKKIGGQQ